MKFLVTGALNRAGGPRVLVAAAAFIFGLFEALAAVLLLADTAPAETIVLVLEEVHILVFFRGLEALFLGSVILGLPLPDVVRKSFPVTLFAVPLTAAVCAVLAVPFPWMHPLAQLFALASSAFVIASSALVCWKLYAR